jgi:hypothetical protein
MNPMIAFYGANGMAEMVYLLPLALGWALFLRWTRTPRWQYLPLSGLVFAFGVLARYEVVFWAGIVAVGIVAVLVRARATVDRIEASMLTFGAPPLYGFLLWSFLTWEILGKPFAWFSGAAPTTPAATAGSSGASAVHLAVSALREQAGLFAATFVVAALVLLVAVRRRSVPGLLVAATLLASPLIAIGLVAASRNPGYLELRYNMRAMPLTVIAVGWLLSTVEPRRRRAASVAAVVLFVASIPLTARTMWASGLGFDRVFVRGILEGQRDVAGAEQRTSACRVALYAREHVPARNAILTDDAQTFDVMLCDGHPERYFDRVDRGDIGWTRALDAVFARRGPVGSVRYLLVARGLRGRLDLMVQRHPSLRAGPLPRFVTPVLVDPSFALYRLRPPDTALSLDQRIEMR